MGNPSIGNVKTQQAILQPFCGFDWFDFKSAIRDLELVYVVEWTWTEFGVNLHRVCFY